MKQRFFIFLGLTLLIVVLIGLNVVSFSQKEKEPDTEFSPNRSTFNVGATGTRAFFDLLAETGRNPVRWTEPPAALLADARSRPATFVIIGRTRQNIDEDEAAQILRWVSTGGKLVVIDRVPPESLVTTTANWSLSINSNVRQPFFDTDASDQQQMTAGMSAARPAQPSLYTQNVNGVQPSAFASSLNFEYLGTADAPKKKNASNGGVQPTPVPTFFKGQRETYEKPPREFTAATPKTVEENNEPAAGLGSGSGRGDDAEEPVVVVKPTPAPPLVVKATPTPFAVVKEAPVETVALDAPVVHLAADGRNLLVDVPFGSGRIVYLTDPYIVANGGIGLVDNAQLAINLVDAGGGVIAFDEYHQGYGSNRNRLLQYFSGTPVLPIVVQLVVLIALVLFSQSRRFARALPEQAPDRLSKLEYVAAMAELQQRTKAYDLAMENIYADFRRRVTRLVGVDNRLTRPDQLARLIAERLPDEKADELETLMRHCEDIMHGEPTGKKEILRLTARLRELEEKLGLQRRKRGRATI